MSRYAHPKAPPRLQGPTQDQARLDKLSSNELAARNRRHANKTSANVFGVGPSKTNSKPAQNRRLKPKETKSSQLRKGAQAVNKTDAGAQPRKPNSVLNQVLQEAGLQRGPRHRSGNAAARPPKKPEASTSLRDAAQVDARPVPQRATVGDDADAQFYALASLHPELAGLSPDHLQRLLDHVRGQQADARPASDMQEQSYLHPSGLSTGEYDGGRLQAAPPSVQHAQDDLDRAQGYRFQNPAHSVHASQSHLPPVQHLPSQLEPGTTFPTGHMPQASGFVSGSNPYGNTALAPPFHNTSPSRNADNNRPIGGLGALIGVSERASDAERRKKLQLQADLAAQVREKEERKRLEKLRQQQEEQRQMRETAAYDPFGKPGAGAPPQRGQPVTSYSAQGATAFGGSVEQVQQQHVNTRAGPGMSMEMYTSSLSSSQQQYQQNSHQGASVGNYGGDGFTNSGYVSAPAPGVDYQQGFDHAHPTQQHQAGQQYHQQQHHQQQHHQQQHHQQQHHQQQHHQQQHHQQQHHQQQHLPGFAPHADTARAAANSFGAAHTQRQNIAELSRQGFLSAGGAEAEEQRRRAALLAQQEEIRQQIEEQKCLKAQREEEERRREEEDRLRVLKEQEELNRKYEEERKREEERQERKRQQQDALKAAAMDAQHKAKEAKAAAAAAHRAQHLAKGMDDEDQHERQGQPGLNAIRQRTSSQWSHDVTEGPPAGARLTIASIAEEDNITGGVSQSGASPKPPETAQRRPSRSRLPVRSARKQRQAVEDHSSEEHDDQNDSAQTHQRTRAAASRNGRNKDQQAHTSDSSVGQQRPGKPVTSSADARQQQRKHRAAPEPRSLTRNKQRTYTKGAEGRTHANEHDRESAAADESRHLNRKAQATYVKESSSKKAGSSLEQQHLGSTPLEPSPPKAEQSRRRPHQRRQASRAPSTDRQGQESSAQARQREQAKASQSRREHDRAPLAEAAKDSPVSSTLQRMKERLRARKQQLDSEISESSSMLETAGMVFAVNELSRTRAARDLPL